MLTEQLEFIFEAPSLDAQYYREGAQDLIQKLVPEDLLASSGFRSAAQKARFADLLPLISWSDLSKAPCTLSVLLLCKYRFNACNFFYDMVSRWLLPNKRINVELFFASDVRLPHLSEELLSVAEIVIQLKSTQDVEEVKRNLRTIETEIRLGVVSNYHARRILEFKGLSEDGKTAMIQEKISSLIHNHSKDFDQGIFTQMQQFLVTCRPEFKEMRDYHHISRIISNIYSLRKALQTSADCIKTKRRVSVKLLKTRLEMSKNNLQKPVLGVLIGLNFLNEQEKFEAEHLSYAIQKIFPAASVVEGSSFTEKEGPLQILYLEIEKKGGLDFTLEEIQLLRNTLPERAQSHIERLANPIFMPRNEEEVLRNMMTLAKQLRFVNDAPQVILSLDEQQEDDLCFTIVVARLIPEGAPSFAEQLAKISFGEECPVRFFIDRLRRMGRFRRRHLKETIVLRALIPHRLFLREDHSIDFYKARTHVLNALSEILGAVRDFNGGMILRQGEHLNALKASLGKAFQYQNLLIEKFFYALAPMEMRSTLELESLKQFFLLFLQARRTDIAQKKQDSAKTMAVSPLFDGIKKKKILEKIQSLQIPSHQLVSLQIDDHDTSFIGAILFSEEDALQTRFLQIF